MSILLSRCYRDEVRLAPSYSWCNLSCNHSPGQPLEQVLPFGPGDGDLFQAVLSQGYGGRANQRYLLFARFSRNLDPSAYASDSTRKFSSSLAIMRKRALCSRVGLHDGYEPPRLTSNNVGSCWLTMLRPFVRSLIRRNISQHCRPNNVGSWCVRVGSGVQRDATTPSNTQQNVTGCVNGRNM